MYKTYDTITQNRISFIISNEGEQIIELITKNSKLSLGVLGVLSVLGGQIICEICVICGLNNDKQTQFHRKDHPEDFHNSKFIIQNSLLWCIMAKNGAVLDTFGVVWDYFGSIIKPINLIFDTKNKENEITTTARERELPECVCD